MAQPNLDSRVDEARKQLEMIVGPQAPISGPDGVDMPQPNSGFIPSPGPGQPSRLTINPSGFPDARQAQPGETPQMGVTPVESPAPAAENVIPLPTPEDNTSQLIEQRRAQAIEALKAEGFDGYTPDISDAQQWDVNQQSMIGKAVTDIFAGFNTSVARTLSLPREVVDQGMGLLGLDYMQHGGPQQQTVDALNRMGIPTYEIDNLANKIGQGALPALATWGAMQLAAPSMAAKQGFGTFDYVARNIGEWAMKHPVVGLWLGQTSQAGGKLATQIVNPTSDFGKGATELAGEIAGGMAPGAIKGAVKLPFKALGTIPGVGPLARNAARITGEGINTLSENLPTDLSNAIKKYNPFYKQPQFTPAKESLVNPNIDANRLQTFSQDQIASAMTYQDRAIENAIKSIPTSGTSGQVQARTHVLLQDAEKISKRIVSGFWDRVPLKTRISVSDLYRDVRNLRRELVDSNNVRPDEMIDRVLATVQPRRGMNGQIVSAMPTLQKLRDLQSQIGTAITEERARDAPREGQVRNLARISEMIDDNISRQLPNDTSIEQARNMSKRHNDLFSRGPINDILSKRRSGDFRVPQAASIDTLMQKTDGLAALKAVQEGVSNYPRIPTNKFRPRAYYANPNAVTPVEKDTLNQLVKSAEDSIRASFREVAEQGPEKAVAYSVKNEEAIRALAGVAGELNFTAQKVAGALAEKKSITASALARFAQTSGDNAVKNIFAQRDPAAVAGQLMIRFRGDPDALEGLRNQVLNEFIYNRAGTNPNLMQKMMQEPRYEKLLKAVLADDQWARLNRMVNAAVHIGAENETGIKSFFRAPFRTAGRLAGAAFGRRVAPGTLQGPSIFSKAAGEFMEKSLGGTDPQDLLAHAVLDPNWEALLYSRIPTTTKDMRAAQTHYKRLFATMNSSQQAVLDKLSKDKDKD